MVTPISAFRSVPARLGLVVPLLALASCSQGAGIVPANGDTSPSVLADRSVSSPGTAPVTSPSTSAPVSTGEPNAYPPDLPRAEGRASWILYPTFAEVIGRADVFVVGKVRVVSPGREAGSKFPLPTTVSEIEVFDVGKGPAPSSVIKVEQTGGVYRPAHAREDAKLRPAPLPSDAPEGVEPLTPGDPPEELLLEVADDPLFRPNERVALALRWVPEFELYQLLNPQGRFTIADGDRVFPILADDAAVKFLSGVGVRDLLEEVRRLAT